MEECDVACDVSWETGVVLELNDWKLFTRQAIDQIARKVKYVSLQKNQRQVLCVEDKVLMKRSFLSSRILLLLVLKALSWN